MGRERQGHQRQVEGGMGFSWGSKPYVINEGAKADCNILGDGAKPLPVEEVDDVCSFMHGLQDTPSIPVTKDGQDCWQLGP